MKLILSLFLIILLTNPLYAQKIVVGVSIPPQKYFVKKIGKDLVDVIVLLPAGANPVLYEPKPNQIKMLSKAKLFFSIGVPFEKPWIKRLKKEFPNLRIIPMYKSVKRRPMKKNYLFLRRKIINKNPDPHIWLSPPLVRLIAIDVLNGLIQAEPERKNFFYRNYVNFVKEIWEVDLNILDLFKNAKKRAFLVFHPSWGYFALAYNLKQIPLEIGGKSPTIKDMSFFIDFAKKNRLKTIFVQPQFSSRFAKILARSIGGKVEVIDPLAESWKENLIRSANLIRRSLK